MKSMSVNPDDFQKFVGRKKSAEDVVTAYMVRAFAATFGRTEPDKPGDPVPPGWHDLFFIETPQQTELAQDGYQRESWLAPPIPLPRLMFAASRGSFPGLARIGDTIRREVECKSVTAKQGSSSGLLVFTTVRQRVYGPAGLIIDEERDAVFREAVKPGEKNVAPKHEPPPPDTVWKRTIMPDEIMLFRYSAFTFNSHRIHYDHPYVTKVEGYPALVVQGPLTMTCLLDLSRDSMPNKRIASYSMRAKAPLFANTPFDMVGRPSADGKTADLWAVTPDGTTAQQMQVTYA
jgi:3-methylfumaryl-CoA hydratase